MLCQLISLAVFVCSQWRETASSKSWSGWAGLSSVTAGGLRERLSTYMSQGRQAEHPAMASEMMSSSSPGDQGLGFWVGASVYVDLAGCKTWIHPRLQFASVDLSSRRGWVDAEQYLSPLNFFLVRVMAWHYFSEQQLGSFWLGRPIFNVTNLNLCLS